MFLTVVILFACCLLPPNRCQSECDVNRFTVRWYTLQYIRAWLKIKIYLFPIAFNLEYAIIWTVWCVKTLIICKQSNSRELLCSITRVPIHRRERICCCLPFPPLIRSLSVAYLFICSFKDLCCCLFIIVFFSLAAELFLPPSH